MVFSLRNPHDLLYSSDSEDEGVRQIRVADEGSRPQLAHVIVHGVPADGVIGAQSLFELNWIQAQPPRMKLIKYSYDL